VVDHDSVDQDAFELMRDIERQTPDEIRRRRLTHRIALKVRVFVQPGNASDLQTLKLEGVLGDISTHGCRIMTGLPLRVGDIYRLRFDGQLSELPVTFMRCLRCHLVREDAFESGFKSFHPLALPETGGLRAEADLLAKGGFERS
jgi:hypothetical protein